MIKKVSIRGIEIQAVKNKEYFANFLMNENEIKQGGLVAINAEKVIISEKNPQLARFLQESEFNYADGVSIVYSIRKKYPQYHLDRIAGVELWETLMQKAGRLNIPVFLIGSSDETLNKVVDKLAQWNVNIVGLQNGYFKAEEEQTIIKQIKQSGAKFITVAMGTPKQELFMQKAKHQYPQALYMGVGGTYDVFAGKIKRAPISWRKYGFEWLYRLLRQPTRWQRQVNLIKYAYYYLTNRL
ncbi:lipopolysaccharide N-acetylmannosaminouronosyltransferase [Mannheimia sp. AT1]|uniref:Lipopolysaccharide N-acetylmannosaminouronosyltransferase n=1 Tax=Mannheimia cairinae TaxID=3025936 RepID=A0ABT5MS09_9PAST|nr:lipopolysaccharide N-acetylmannosaminouronosyltransferase [Mannheimia cairinae]MDD0824965.1 lipopolysaccharide N-acetylmannosaminouronosyltransferase [Mannheimia cairinae]MDD0827203.1 lipopolysaccharide N-acetylmannosaminouronosyltransferase [Mannheimia cairinae]